MQEKVGPVGPLQNGAPTQSAAGSCASNRPRRLGGLMAGGGVRGGWELDALDATGVRSAGGRDAGGPSRVNVRGARLLSPVRSPTSRPTDAPSGSRTGR